MRTALAVPWYRPHGFIALQHSEFYKDNN